MDTVYFTVALLTLTKNSLSLASKDQADINKISLQRGTLAHDEVSLHIENSLKVLFQERYTARVLPANKRPWIFYLLYITFGIAA